MDFTDKTVQVSIGELEDLELDSDLTILFSSHEKLPLGERIVSVGGEIFVERGTLRLAISTMDASVPVEVGLFKMLSEGENEKELPDDLRAQVDGAETKLRVPSPWIEDDEFEEELPKEFIRASGLLNARVGQQGTGVTPSPQLSPAGGKNSPGMNSETSPRLLEFSTLDYSNPGFELNPDAAHRTALVNTLTQLPVGDCLVVLTEQVNPLGEIEVISKLLRREYIAVHCGQKLRHRPSQTQILHAFVEAMQKGRWFVVLQAHKSIATLRLLENVLVEARKNGFKEWSGAGRLIVSTEPHPHFPPEIASHCVTYRFKSSFDAVALTETFHSSVSKRKMIYGSVRSIAKSMGMHSGSEIMKDEEEPTNKGRKKHVQLNRAVEVVEIPPRTLVSGVVKPTGPVPSGLQKTVTFKGCENDRFLSISACDENYDSLCVGSSLGNLYFLDSNGDSVHVLHAHDTSVWDISCQSPTTFVTGSEDCSAIRWGPQPGGYAQQNQIAKCGHDIFAVKFYDAKVEDTPVFVGGLMSVIVGLTKTGVVQLPVNTSIQALESMPQNGWVLGGGGDGTVVIVDVAESKILHTLPAHAKKVPCISQNNANLIATGSFDSSIKLWDLRASMEDPVHTVRLKSYVTGIDCKGDMLTASVGQNLFLWDIRNLGEIRAGVCKAWETLSRGMLLDTARSQIVTASPDGNVRYWKYQ